MIALSTGNAFHSLQPWFLLPLQVSHLNEPSYHHHTEYVLESGIPNSNVCRPEGYNIDLFRKIYIIFTVWNLSDWVVRMINAFEKVGGAVNCFLIYTILRSC